MLESVIMSCLPRGFPTQRVFIKKTLCYGLYLVANIQVWVYSEDYRQSFIEECIVRDLAWLLSMILMLKGSLVPRPKFFATENAN